MLYYPAWLDSALWISVLTAAVCFLAMKVFKPSATRGFLKLAALILIAFAFTVGATKSILFNAHAPHIALSGTVLLTSIHTGKSSSTTFTLSGAPPDLRLRMDGAHRKIVNGERVDITYQAQSGVVLDLRIVDGPHVGYVYSDHLAGFGPIVALLIAAAFATYGFVDWHQDGTAIPAPPRPNRQARV